MIYLTEEHIKQIEAHGEQTYPRECGGMLIGRFEDGRKTVVELLPKDVLRAERYARSKKLDVVGYYHSHPDHPARPSQFDLDHALPVWTYIIVSVEKGKAVDLRAWEMENDRTKFNEEELINAKLKIQNAKKNSF
jgi:proteasome lid subunit RPN8/RPN11